MSTSLAEQLARLVVPQTTLLTRDKKRPSLLFDPKEAACLDKETVYQIGIDGLEELKHRNPRFAQFEHTLFHVTSKNFQRAVESVEANQKLNKNIRKFLFQLSPYFLFNCSYKALEWMIYRYDIHVYNKEDLLMLVLPYHETNIFVRVLQLLNLKEPQDKWGWLQPLQKSGIHLPKQTLYNHAASAPYFIKFTSNFVLSVIKEHEKPSSLTVIFNYYCTTLTGALEYSQQVNDAQISQMLPVILQGLVSDIADFTAATYIILAKLLTKTQLSDKILEKFVERIAQMNVANLKTEATLVLVVLYQAQKQYKRISGTTVASLHSKAVIPKIIEHLNKEGVHIYPFLQPLMWSCFNSVIAKESNKMCMEFIDSIVGEVKFDSSFVEIVFGLVLNIYNPKRQYSKETIDWLKEFLRKIEKQYPVVYDNFIKKILKPSDNDPLQTKYQRILCKLMGNLTNMQDSFEIFEKLYHPNPTIRVEGIRILNKKYHYLKTKNPEMLQSALIDRINDENWKVVKDTLANFADKFLELVDMNLLKETLVKLLVKCYHKRDELTVIIPEVLQVVCQHFNSSDIKVFLAVLPFLFPFNQQELQFSLQILRSDYLKQSTVNTGLLNASNPQTFCNLILNYFSEPKNIHDIKFVIAALKEMPQGYDHPFCKYLVTILLSNGLSEKSDLETSTLILDIFEILLNNSTMASEVSAIEHTEFDYIALARTNQFPLQGFMRHLKRVMLKTHKPTNEPSTIDFTLDNDVPKFYIRLLHILTKNGVRPNEIQLFFNCFCDGKPILQMELLLNLAVANEELRFACVDIAHDILIKQNNMSVFLDFNQTVVPWILVGLTLPQEKMRQTLLNIITLLVNNVKPGNNYVRFLSELLDNAQEILLNNEVVVSRMFTLLSPGTQNPVVYFDAVLENLLNCVNNSKHPPYLINGLVKLLIFITDANVHLTFLRIATQILNRSTTELNESEGEILRKYFISFASSVPRTLDETSPEWDFIKLTLSKDSLVIKCNQRKPIYPAVLMLNEITRRFFSNLTSNMQEKILDLVIAAATSSQNPEVLQAAGHVFKHIDLDASLVLGHLNRMCDVQSPKLDSSSSAKKKRSILPAPDILDTPDWKKGITVLENIQNKKKIRNLSDIFPVLFEILKKCLDFDEQAIVEYPKQLLLSTILHFCDRTSEEPIPEAAFNMQLVVQCVRASQNPQTHHHALLLLAKAASFIPKQVLHHIIAIFTFMGSSVLRHDDAYSFQIISKIIDTIIPILVENGSEENTAEVLRVFVDAILDIPEHRRKMLFRQLLERLRVKETLHVFVLLICEAHVIHGHTEKQKINKNRSLTALDEVPKRLDIAADLCREFAPEVVIFNCIKLLEYLRKLPEQKDVYTENVDTYTFDIVRYNAKQFRHYKYTIITFIPQLLTSPQFINAVATLPDGEILHLEELFKKSIINILSYIEDTAKIAERNANTPNAQYWKVMLHHGYDTLDAINALLTNELFLLVIRGLLSYSLSAVRKRALELLNNKLQHASGFLDDCDKWDLFDLIVIPLVNTVKTIENPDVDQEQEVIVQRALISLKLLVKHAELVEPEKFARVLDFLARLMKQGANIKLHGNVLASLVLCAAELCGVLGPHAIVHLNKIMPVLIKILKTHKQSDVPGLMIVSGATAVHKILDVLPLFLSPYLEKLLYELTSCSSKWTTATGQIDDADAGDGKLAPFIAKLGGIYQKIGSNIPLRVLLPACRNCYDSLVGKQKYRAIRPLMTVLSENLRTLKGWEVQAYLPDLTDFFLNALQFRADSRVSHEEANLVEGYVIQAFESLILKLSESTFRPLYYRLFDWAVRTDAKTERVITFYNLSNAFANCLKGLFVLFAGHFLNNAATLLDACNKLKKTKLYFPEGDDTDEEKNIILLENILKTLYTVFLYDTHKFVNKERFEVLMQPVVDQLENTLGGIESLKSRSENVLTPCIVQFAVATADDALWKQTNYQILLKTRHNLPEIRLIALKCLSETAKKLGEDFLPLLPETIPFLAELLEDEEEDVEKACQKTVQELEKVLGEPLQKYF